MLGRADEYLLAATWNCGAEFQAGFILCVTRAKDCGTMQGSKRDTVNPVDPTCPHSRRRDALKGWTTCDFPTRVGMARADETWGQGHHQVWHAESDSGMRVDSNPGIAENGQKTK
jgi:hypothetical protein